MKLNKFIFAEYKRLYSDSLFLASITDVSMVEGLGVYFNYEGHACFYDTEFDLL